MPSPTEKTVLVVDDEPDITFFLKVALEDQGFHVMTASDGVEALEQMRTRKPDLISLDLVMPRAGGIKFFRELRKHKEWADIPVLFVTGHAHDTAEGDTMKEILHGKTLSGPATYLEKPVNAETFIRNVKGILGIEEGGDDRTPAEKQSLRHEIESLLEGASPDDLERVRRLLREGKD